MTKQESRWSKIMRSRPSIRFSGVLLAAAALLLISTAGAIDWPRYTAKVSAQGSVVLMPQATAKGPRPILVLLPFTGGSASDLLERWYQYELPQHAEARGYIVVVPSAEGSYEDYSTGAAWAATLKRYSDQVAADVAETVAKHQGDPARVALAGYSMGGDLAWALIQRDRERYSGAVIMGSRASYREKGALERLAQRKVRLFFFMGEQESDVRMAGARAAQDAATKAQLAFRTDAVEGEHITAPPSVFMNAIDYVLGYDGLPPVAMTTPHAMPKPLADEPESDEPTRDHVEVSGGYDRGDAKPIDYSKNHPLRAAITRDRPEGLPTCDWQPFQDAQSSHWGYRDPTGRLVVEASYYEAEEFGDDGLARVWDDSRPGFINCNGDYFEVYKEVEADEFSDDLVRVYDYTHDSQGERIYSIGFVNRRGEMVVPAHHQFATSFCGGVAKVGDYCSVKRDLMARQMDVQCRRWSYIDLQGRAVRQPPADEDCDDIRMEPRYSAEE